MPRSSTLAILAMGWLVVASLRLDAQAVTEQEAPVDVGAEARLVATGQNLPAHLAVEGFFEQALFAYKAGDAAFEFNVLRPLGIVPRSKAAITFEQAMLLARAICAETLPGDALEGDRESVARRQREFQKDRAARLGDLYRDLLADLGNRGIPSSRIENFIRERVVQNVFYHSTGPAAEALDRQAEIDEAFQKGKREEQ